MRSEELHNLLNIWRWALAALLSVLVASCGERAEISNPMFNALGKDRTGLTFSNTLTSTDSLNLFRYMYFYNGAGIGAGDFNNDGLTDLFFASNQGRNSLFLNEGRLKFRNVTEKARIPHDGAWNTGVSVVDINNDGLLDIYISRVGNYHSMQGRNQFLVCQGIEDGVPTYADKAPEFGLDFSGFGTQAAFFDYDMDGDLDVFLLNHSVYENATFRARNEFLGADHPTTGSRLFRNEEGKTFVDVTAQSGVNSTAIGYGLGIAVSDVNLDGYPDIYIGNDFHENDYLYINQGNGTFRDEGPESMMHTSQFTMGVDAADANNDGFPDIISVDMLPSDPYVLKRSLGEDSYDVFFLKISYGYNYQYTRNNLQYNRGNGMFSETGLYSGVAATDWSWSPLWLDFDNDGLKDLFISNGIPKRMNDIDYINYVSDQEIQQKIRDNRISEKDQTLIEKFPQVKIPNMFFRNVGGLQFSDMHNRIGDNISTYSNGAAYADLDNDGDLDIVVNNIDESATIYENTCSGNGGHGFLEVKIHGAPANRNGLGSKLVIFAGDSVMMFEKFPVRGFLSSMEAPLHAGLGTGRVDSAFLIWPDNTFQAIVIDTAKPRVEYHYAGGLPVFDYVKLKQLRTGRSAELVDMTEGLGLGYIHRENKYAEFDREPLLPHMLSTEGPALAVGDMNNDGLDDIFFGSSRGGQSAVFIQSAGGKFRQVAQPYVDADSSYEDVDACWIDVNNDSYADLVVVSGGNEFYGRDRRLMPRVYLNEGGMQLRRKEDAFEDLFQTASCMAPHDFNKDGYVDFFLGGRAVPGKYGEVPRSYLLLNDGTGKFTDVTRQYCPELTNYGFVIGAVWSDMDGNGIDDLLVCSEWGPVDVFLNNGSTLIRKTICERKGWWTFLLPCDINNDGKTDIIAGNLGLNSRLKADLARPVRLYYNDFDDNGIREQILTYYVAGKEVPFASKAEMERQMPVLRKQFLYAEDFAKASLEEILTRQKLESSEVHTADYFSNAVLINKGNMDFELRELPWQAQLSSMKTAVVVDANGDGFPDIIPGGNYYENNIEMGRYDADFGSVLLGNGRDGFVYEQFGGMHLRGQVRKIRKIRAGKQEAYVFARNNDTARVIGFGRLPKATRDEQPRTRGER